MLLHHKVGLALYIFTLVDRGRGTNYLIASLSQINGAVIGKSNSSFDLGADFNVRSWTDFQKIVPLVLTLEFPTIFASMMFKKTHDNSSLCL